MVPSKQILSFVAVNKKVEIDMALCNQKLTVSLQQQKGSNCTTKNPAWNAGMLMLEIAVLVL